MKAKTSSGHRGGPRRAGRERGAAEHAYVVRTPKSLPKAGPDYLYAQEKLGLAVHALAINPGPIKARLFAAYSELSCLMESDLPQELRKDLTWVKQTLAKNPSRVDWDLVNGRLIRCSTGRLRATIPFMRIVRAVSVAERIVYMEARLQDLARRRT
jgi:hypothetical protein